MERLLALLESEKTGRSEGSTESTTIHANRGFRAVLRHAKTLRALGCDSQMISKCALNDQTAIDRCCERILLERNDFNRENAMNAKDSVVVIPRDEKSKDEHTEAQWNERTTTMKKKFTTSKGRERSISASAAPAATAKQRQKKNNINRERAKTNETTSSSSSSFSQIDISTIANSKAMISKRMRERRERDIERAKTMREERERKTKEKKEKEENEERAKRAMLSTRAKEAKRVVLSREKKENTATIKTITTTTTTTKGGSPRQLKKKEKPSYMKALRVKDVNKMTVLAIEEILESLINATVRSASKSAWNRAKMLATQAKVKENNSNTTTRDGEMNTKNASSASLPVSAKKITNFIALVKAAAKESALQKRNRERKEEKEKADAEKKLKEKLAFQEQRRKAELLRVKLEDLRQQKEKATAEKKRALREKKKIEEEKKIEREERQRRRDQAAMEVARKAREKAEVNALVDLLVNEIVRDFNRKIPVLRVPVDASRSRNHQNSQRRQQQQQQQQLFA